MHLCLTNFNPRSHEGNDYRLACLCGLRRQFQSTLPRGERPIPWPAEDWKRIFQSTLPRGERLDSYADLPVKVKFQSTLPRGERLAALERTGLSGQISIHAPTRGTTYDPFLGVRSSGNFNPRSHEGNDRHVGGHDRRNSRFQSTLPRGERPLNL